MLTETEKGAINAFISNEVMVRAVQKVLLSAVYSEGTVKSQGIQKNSVLDLAANYEDNKLLGAKVRAVFEGTKLLENGFNELLRYREKKQGGNKSNPAR